MFANAYEITRQFTRPVVLSQRLADGRVTCGIGSFIVVNADGWIATAAHIVQPMLEFSRHQQEKSVYDAQVLAIQNDPNLPPKHKRRQIGNLNKNSDWIINQSYWWAMQSSASGPTFHVNLMADVAIGKLTNFDTSGIAAFPVFKNPATNPRLGSSLCRLGFPFHALSASFDENSNGFTINNFTPPPMFPNDGIHTRMALVPDTTGAVVARFIETSTPGLRGQSGGPLFDIRGEIWGIQSRTAHLELGFSPTKKDGAKEIVEHQFMNVGLASHVSHVIDLFNAHGVQFQIAA